jgi:hypothetical protein
MATDFDAGRAKIDALVDVWKQDCVVESGSKEWKLCLRWSGWGTSIAVATGLYHYRHGEYRDGRLVYPVVSTRIVLSRIRVRRAARLHERGRRRRDQLTLG